MPPDAARDGAGVGEEAAADRQRAERGARDDLPGIDDAVAPLAERRIAQHARGARQGQRGTGAERELHAGRCRQLGRGDTLPDIVLRDAAQGDGRVVDGLGRGGDQPGLAAGQQDAARPAPAWRCERRAVGDRELGERAAEVQRAVIGDAVQRGAARAGQPAAGIDDGAVPQRAGQRRGGRWRCPGRWPACRRPGPACPHRQHAAGQRDLAQPGQVSDPASDSTPP